MRRTLNGVLFFGIVLMACAGSGSSDGTSNKNDGTIPPRSEQDAPELSAESFVEALTSSDLPVGASVVFTAETNPNMNLGRPGQYVAKTAWADTRVECFSEQPTWDCGGDIELFDDDDALEARYEYLAPFAGDPPLGGFYMWRIPNGIVRVGFALTPEQADEYDVFLSELVHGDVERLEE